MNPREFLRAFFGEGNRLRADMEAVGYWVTDIEADSVRAVLPRVRPERAEVTEWYVLARTDAEFRRVAEEAGAFVGGSYVRFQPMRARLDLNDPVDRAASEWAEGRVLRFETPKDQRKAVLERLTEMRELWRRRPNRPTIRFRPTGRILLDFGLAEERRDDEAMRALEAELTSQQRLEARNLLFLEIRRLAAMERWGDIVHHRRLDELLALRRPRRINEAFVRAVYRQYLRTAEDPEDCRPLMQAFERIWDRFSPIYDSRAGARFPEALKGFMLAALRSNDSAHAVAARILQDVPADHPDRPLLERLGREAIVPAKAGAEERSIQAARLVTDCDYDGALALLEDCPPNVRNLRLLIRCVAGSESTEAAARLADGFRAAAGEVRDEALRDGVTRSLWTGLTERLGFNEAPGKVKAPPRDWNAWLDQVLAGEVPASAASSLAEQGAREWDRDGFLADEAAVDRFAGRLYEAATGAKGRVLRENVPPLLRFFLPDGNPDEHPKVAQVLDSLRMLLALDESPSKETFSTLVDVIEARIQCGISRDEYAQALEDFESLWNSHGGVRRLYVALELIDRLIELQQPHPAALPALVQRIANSLAATWKRLSDIDRSVLVSLGTEVGLELQREPSTDAALDEAGENELVHLSGRSVALYSLHTPAVQRARRILEDSVSDVTVQVFDDQVGGGGALRAAARAADVFVVVWRAAKHSTTEFIRAERPPDSPLLQAPGKGSASILRVLKQWKPE